MGERMSRDHVDHSHILTFAKDRVNLPQEKANELRAQGLRLREKLAAYLKEHPDFSLRKMLVSGSLAKGTALRSLNDIDVACYISGTDAPETIDALLEYLAERLRKAFPNFTPDQIQPQTYCVTVSFKGTGLDVDVVPILYDGDPDWYGNLVSQIDGSFLRTCIPRHLEFVRKRKSANQDFSQVVRLVKFWARLQKNEDPNFRFKSFMIELILAKLSDDGCSFSDYPEALQHFFLFLQTDMLCSQIAFSDYYSKASVPACTDRVKIFDPVNAENNVSDLYTVTNVNSIVAAAMDASEAIDAALYAPTKGETVTYWQKVFGPSFSA